MISHSFGVPTKPGYFLAIHEVPWISKKSLKLMAGAVGYATYLTHYPGKVPFFLWVLVSPL